MPEGQPRAGLADLNERRAISCATSSTPTWNRVSPSARARLAAPRHVAVAGHHPQRHGGPGGGRAALRAAHLGRRLPTERGSACSSAPLELAASARKSARRSTQVRRRRPQPRRRAGGRHTMPRACRAAPPGGGPEDGAPAEAHRIRPSWARPRPRGHGDRGRLVENRIIDVPMGLRPPR